MNKNTVNREIDIAYTVLKETGIAVDGKINKAFRGQISTFGAAVSTGSLLAAIAFFMDQAGASVDRTKIMDAILKILKWEKVAGEQYKTLFEYARENQIEAKEHIINAAIALKLAMNLYHLEQVK